jgi:transcriptional regulator GlxA family with amidase domain
MRTTSTGTFRIGLLLYPGCMPAGLFAFADLLTSANARAGRAAFHTEFVALEAGPVNCAHGHLLPASVSLARAELDAILVPPCWTESLQELEQVVEDRQAVVNGLSQLGSEVMLLSYCVGVCLVAATGRLKGQPATTSWWLADMMRKRHPNVIWNIELSVIANRRNATAAAAFAFQLLAKELMDKYIGKQVYSDMIKMMVLPRPDRAHQVFHAMDIVQQGDELMRQLFITAQALPAADLTVRKLAGAIGTTERTLSRKVSAASGLPIASYLRRIKLHQVSERLILTSVPASAISDALGFSSESTMRRMFKGLTGLTPLEYRCRYKRPQTAA